MAQNEMRAKGGLPLRVRSTDGLERCLKKARTAWARLPAQALVFIADALPRKLLSSCLCFKLGLDSRTCHQERAATRSRRCYNGAPMHLPGSSAAACVASGNAHCLGPYQREQGPVIRDKRAPWRPDSPRILPSWQGGSLAAKGRAARADQQFDSSVAGNDCASLMAASRIRACALTFDMSGSRRQCRLGPE